MGKRLYVGNLSWDTNEDKLSSVFSEAGTVTSIKLVTDRETGRSRGFAFVEMSSDEETSNAIEMMHEKEVDGRKLNVNEAKPQEPRR